MSVFSHTKILFLVPLLFVSLHIRLLNSQVFKFTFYDILYCSIAYFSILPIKIYNHSTVVLVIEMLCYAYATLTFTTEVLHYGILQKPLTVDKWKYVLGLLVRLFPYAWNL